MSRLYSLSSGAIIISFASSLAMCLACAKKDANFPFANGACPQSINNIVRMLKRSGLASRARFSIERSLPGLCCQVCKFKSVEFSIYLACSADSFFTKSGSYTPRVTSKSSQKLRTSRLTEPNKATCRSTTTLLVCSSPP